MKQGAQEFSPFGEMTESYSFNGRHPECSEGTP